MRPASERPSQLPTTSVLGGLLVNPGTWAKQGMTVERLTDALARGEMKIPRMPTDSDIEAVVLGLHRMGKLHAAATVAAHKSQEQAKNRLRRNKGEAPPVADPSRLPAWGPLLTQLLRQGMPLWHQPRWSRAQILDTLLSLDDVDVLQVALSAPDAPTMAQLDAAAREIGTKNHRLGTLLQQVIARCPGHLALALLERGADPTLESVHDPLLHRIQDPNVLAWFVRHTPQSQMPDAANAALMLAWMQSGAAPLLLPIWWQHHGMTASAVGDLFAAHMDRVSTESLEAAVAHFGQLPQPTQGLSLLECDAQAHVRAPEAPSITAERLLLLAHGRATDERAPTLDDPTLVALWGHWALDEHHREHSPRSWRPYARLHERDRHELMGESLYIWTTNRVMQRYGLERQGDWATLDAHCNTVLAQTPEAERAGLRRAWSTSVLRWLDQTAHTDLRAAFEPYFWTWMRDSVAAQARESTVSGRTSDFIDQLSRWPAMPPCDAATWVAFLPMMGTPMRRAPILPEAVRPPPGRMMADHVVWRMLEAVAPGTWTEALQRQALDLLTTARTERGQRSKIRFQPPGHEPPLHLLDALMLKVTTALPQAERARPRL